MIVYDARNVEVGMRERAKSILVVEDDAAIRSLLVDVLTDEGYSVRAAADGEEALALLGEALPALIILDQLMPRMDGAAFRAVQRTRPDLAPIPTLLLSAVRDLPEQALALDLAATMPKPFNLDELLGLAGELIAAAERGAVTHADTLHPVPSGGPMRAVTQGDGRAS
jgi:CheY-like chemotaxis protein